MNSDIRLVWTFITWNLPKMLKKDFRLCADWLIIDISLPENMGGLTVVERDPRKAKYKPAAYVGTVVEEGPQCKHVVRGDKVVFQRWEYSQFDVDEAHIAIREVDLLTVNNECAPRYIAMQVYDPLADTKLILDPEIIRELHSREKFYFGKIISLGPDRENKDSEELKEGDLIWVHKMDDYQFKIGQHTLVFRDDYDIVMMKGEPVTVPQLEVVV